MDNAELPQPSLGKFAALRARIAKIAHWRHDDLLRRMARNAGLLLAGEGAGAVMGLAALALTARGLGPSLFGVLALAQTYTKMIDTLARFQTWQLIVKYGAEALAQDRPEDFKKLIRFGTYLDLSTALIAAAVAAAAAPLVAWVFGWEPAAMVLAWIFCGRLLFTVSSTPLGILRLFNRFDLLAKAAPIGNTARLIGVAIAFFADLGMIGFAVAWVAAAIVDRMVTVYLAWRELHVRGLRAGMPWWPRGVVAAHPGLWKFAWSTNFVASFALAGKDLDLLLVGAMLNTDAAGLYKIASDFAAVVNTPHRFLNATIFPELARLWADEATRTFRRLMLRTSLIVGTSAVVLVLLFVFLGDNLIKLVVGRQYVDAHALLVLLVLARTIRIASLPFTQALNAMGRATKNLRVGLTTTVLGASLVTVGIKLLELVGLGIARVAVECVTLALTLRYARRYLSREMKKEATTPRPQSA